MSAQRVVVTGLGVISSLGNDTVSFAEGLYAGRSGIRPITAFDTSGYRTSNGGEVDAARRSPGRRAKRGTRRRPGGDLDRASWLAQLAAEQAVRDAGLPLSAAESAADETAQRRGLVTGSTLGGMLGAEDYLRRGGRARDAARLCAFPPHAVNDHLAAEFGFRGPSFAVSTACSAGAMAIGQAVDVIRCGKAAVILAVGVDPMTRLTLAGFGVLKALTKERIRPFDKHRSGFSLGEGAGVLLLESFDHARRRRAMAYCELAGYGLSCDAYHMTAPDKEGRGAARAMHLALQDAGVDAAAVQYINAHGTATQLNDAAETRAIKAVFGDAAYGVPISSTKSMLGHTLGAAGALEAIATILAMRCGFVPPTINYETPDPACDLDYVPNVARRQPIHIALSNSFGFGGNNVCLVFMTCAELPRHPWTAAEPPGGASV
ncbi:MAG: beta-ketoacyl-[acyl-carrier-protein] synthase family protein [Candidatus Tectomicrobia bacterium]|nr:beta-ketoacyl-[acyl-carrier-protein] synthase family protein [Candidatus Tectomicrobia bacterium]